MRLRRRQPVAATHQYKNRDSPCNERHFTRLARSQIREEDKWQDTQQRRGMVRQSRRAQ
jgi:hypothetical protein